MRSLLVGLLLAGTLFCGSLSNSVERRYTRVTDSSPVTVLRPGYYFNNATGAATYNLPAIVTGAIGYTYCFSNDATRTGAITLQLPAATYINYAGALGSAAGTLVSSGALDDSVCVVAYSATRYKAFVGTGTWTNN